VSPTYAREIQGEELGCGLDGLLRARREVLRGIAVSSRTRSPLFPNLPTIDEAGVKGYEMTYWFGAYVPIKTPDATVRRLNELLVRAVGSEPVKAHFAKNALVAFPTTPEQLAKFQTAEGEKWGRIIKTAGIQPE